MRTTRRTRIIGGITAGAAATAVVGGLAFGSPSGATETSYNLLKPESVDNVPLAALVEGEQQLVGAAGAGSYVVQRVGDHLTIVSASPAAGWTVDVKWNDSQVVKAVFSDTLTKVVAIAKLGGDQLVDVAAIQEAIPQPIAAPAVAEATRDVKAQAFGDDDHDGWCDGDKDGDFESAGFRDGDGDHDWDGDRDGRRGRHHRGDRDWEG